MRQSPGRPGVRVRRHRVVDGAPDLDHDPAVVRPPCGGAPDESGLPVGELDLDAPVSFFEFGVVHTGADLEAKTLSIVRQPNGACRADPEGAEKTDTSNG